jgi:hypothetical protein
MTQSLDVSLSSDVISYDCRLRVPSDGRSSDCGWFYLEGRVTPEKSEAGYRESGCWSVQRHCNGTGGANRSSYV